LSLHHVSLEVPPDEAERTVAFWELIGFRRIEAPEEVAPFVTWLERDSHQIHLIHTDAAAVPSLGHTAVVAENFDECVGRLRDAGFEVAEARELWGERRAFTIGPAGHRVELMEAAPPPTT
jgi:catechol 2,3-dioxygenase-like lactoylglutathione lyase family enzyme